MMGPKLISCRVMIDEIGPFLPAGIETEVLDISLHTRPSLLREKIQGIIDAADGKYDPIYLGYGMCSKATVGLVATKSRLIVPKTDDCIGIFLGSQKAQRVEMAKEPGTYFLTQGWIGDGAGSPFSDYERMVQRYGKDKAEMLLGLMLRHYKRLAYIRMPNTQNQEGDRTYAQKMAKRFRMNYVELEGTSRILRQMIAEDWDDNFIVVEPGRPIDLKQFLTCPTQTTSMGALHGKIK